MIAAISSQSLEWLARSDSRRSGSSSVGSGRLDALLSANLARVVTVRQNVIVQKVSAWGAIAVVPTIITGIYGRNFRRFPELGWAFGYRSRSSS